MDIHPIRTEADYEAALEEIESLFDVVVGSPERDRLDVLATLVSAYEDIHDPIDFPDPIEAIKYHMESRGLTTIDLEPLIGSQKCVTEILERMQPLSLEMIRKLHTQLGIPAEILIKPHSTLSIAA